jgi:hypothetical protein
MSYKLGLLFAFAVAAGFATSPAGAAVFEVDTTIDDAGLAGCDDATPNDCSLRGAIVRANGLSEPVTINVPSGTYVLTQSTGCFFLGNGRGALFVTPALCPTGMLTVIGDGAGATIIDAHQPPDAVNVIAPVMFVAATASVTIRGIAMQKGNFSAGSLIGHGGGINNAGTLVLEDSAVTDNVTSDKGGGIYNQGDLTLLRSSITRNFAAHEGGGISNTCRFDICSGGIMEIADSVISRNTAGTLAGGIANFFGTVAVSGTTVSGNLGPVNGNGGGGIWNGSFNTMTLTNVTVSGNRSASGGGILNSGNLYLNNVTIANNTAQWETDPSRGDGGGLYNGGSLVALRNTIIAGNFAASPFPAGADCLASRAAPLTSQGHNLIQDASACTITGDVTGNIVGQDPKLGVLAQNGGTAPTHALAAGSPAIDAANPSTPGSGGAACAVTDQRGVFRPLGAACDIGSFERGGAFQLAKVSPGAGGNTGQVSVQVAGNGFVDGASVKLSRSGQPDIPGNLVQVDVGGAAMAATFDLAGRSPGGWDLVVTNPDSTSRTLPAAFSIQPGVGPKPWVDVIAMIRRHGTSFVTISYGNRGDVDALAVPLSLSLPLGYQAARQFAITPPPAQLGEERPDWSLMPPAMAQQSGSSFVQLPLLLATVPSGFSGFLRIELTLPENSQDTFLVAAIGDPRFATGPDPRFIADAVSGAQAYLQQVLGITIAPTVMSQLQAYATSQFQRVVADGQVAFTSTLGTDPRVYSLAQLQLDLAFFAATRAAKTAAAAPSSTPH